jgi:hypothetical protein
MPLTQVQRDLNIYTQEKAYKVLLDVAQAFEIAGRPKTESAACVGSVFVRIAATIAVHANASRERWLTMCGEVYDLAKQAEREADEN